MEQLQLAILNIILNNPKRRNYIFKELSEKHFTGYYKTIFKECLKRHFNKQDIDIIVLTTDLGKPYYEILLKIANDTNVYLALEEYIKNLKETYCRNQAFAEIQNIDLEHEPISTLRDKLLNISKTLNINNEKYKSQDIKNGLLQAFNRLEEKKEYIRTWFKKLDKFVLIGRGDYIIIGGRPSAGKTTFALNVMLKMAEKYKVVFFSYETNVEKVYDKILTIISKIDYNKVLNSSVNEEDYTNILQNIDKASNYNYEVVEASGMNVNDIRNVAIEKGADIIFIDYLGLIDKKGSGNNLYEQMTNISNKLHILAQQEKITVVALTQLNRMAEGKEPTMADIRDSGAIEQDADAILLLHNEKESNEPTGIRTLNIVKNKLGNIGKIPYKFYGNTQTFIETEIM